MRVLMLSDWMSNRGGAENYALSLRDALRDGGDEVTLISCGAKRHADGAGDLHAFGSDHVLPQAFLQIVNPFAAAAVRTAVKSFRPDVAFIGQFAYHLSPAVLGAVSPVPSVVMLPDYKAICPLGTRLLRDGSICGTPAGRICRTGGCVGAVHWVRDQPRYARIRSGLATARRVICASEWMKRELHASGIDALVIPNAVPEPAAFNRIPADVPTFAYCGRLSREKGVAVLLAAFAALKMPAARLRIVGDGPLREELRQLAGLLGIMSQVDFRGWVESDRVFDELTDVWAVVSPSLWAEPFGLVAVESVVRGIPVIASDSGGFRDTVEPGRSGLLFPAGDVTALAARLRAVASREEFADHAIHADVISRARSSYGMKRNAARIREVLAQAAH